MEHWIAYNKINFSTKCEITDIRYIDDVLKISIKDKESFDMIFEKIYCYKFTIENGIIDRLISSNWKGENGIATVNNSEYIKEFEFQSSGTRPMNGVVHYIIFDGINSIVEVLSLSEPNILLI